MNITIIGTGYIGLTEGVCLADLGHQITCVDIDKQKIQQLQQGIPTLYEEGLQEILTRNIQNKTISFTANLAEALKEAEVIFIAVNTPENKDGTADLSAVFGVAKQIAKTITDSKYYVVVTRSTVPVGINRKIKKSIQETNLSLKFDIVSNPEFSKQGSSIKDFLYPDRIIVGVENDSAKKAMSKLYQPITEKGYPIIFTTIETAELIKYASNAFLAAKIGFINEMADLCEKTGGNVIELAQAMGLDKRIGNKFLNAGPGMGGSCFPKDTVALVRTGEEYDVDISIIRATVESNIKRKKAMAEKIAKILNGVQNKKITLLGLTFKANTDDTRYSPALDIIEGLNQKKAIVNAYDPQGIPKTKQMLSNEALQNISFFSNPYEASQNSECIVVVTEWEEFKKLDYKKISGLVKDKIIVDLRNILNEKELQKLGFKYFGIGK